MPFPRPRLTIGRLMALVALSALVPMSILGRHWWTLRGNYLMAAEYEAEEQAERQEQVDGHDSLRRRGLDKQPLFPVVDQLARRRLAYHIEMRRKYEHAAAHPWEPQPTDPGEPTDDRIVKRFADLGPLPKIDDDVPYLAVDPTGPAAAQPGRP